MSNESLIVLSKTWFDRLHQRERMILLILVALIVFLISGWWLTSSYETLIDARKAQAQAAQSLAWMEAQESRVNHLTQPQDDRSDPRSLLSISTQAASAEGINVTRFEPKGALRLQLWLEDTDYLTLLRWLQRLRSTAGVQLMDFTLLAETTPGKVRASVTLEKTGH